MRAQAAGVSAAYKLEQMGRAVNIANSQARIPFGEMIGPITPPPASLPSEYIRVDAIVPILQHNALLRRNDAGKRKETNASPSRITGGR